MSSVKIIIDDEVYCRVLGLSKAQLDFIDSDFAVYKDGYRFTPQYKLGRWDGKIHFFDRYQKTYGRIPYRLLDKVIERLTAWSLDFDIEDNRKAQKEYNGQIHANWFSDKPDVENKKLILRPYQVEAINMAIEARCGFIEAATGAGKSFMIAALTDFLSLFEIRSIVIVPSVDLIKQTVASMKVGMLDVGEFGGGVKDLDHQIVVSTWQTLQNLPETMKLFDAVIVDEAHGAVASVISTLLNEHGSHIAYRWGFTGTMPKPKTDEMALRGSIGEVLYQITAAELMRLGYLATIEIQPAEIIAPIDDNFPDYSSEKAYLTKNEDRLEVIADLIIDAAATHGNTLVLVNSIKQGKQLQKLIKDSVFLEGATENEVRAEWYSMFENHDNLIVIATSGIASTGISIDRVFALILVDAGKSFIKCIQSIGRGLRMGRDKTSVFCLDIYSNLKWSKKHAKERLSYYKNASYKVLKAIKLKI